MGGNGGGPVGAFCFAHTSIESQTYANMESSLSLFLYTVVVLVAVPYFRNAFLVRLGRLWCSVQKRRGGTRTGIPLAACCALSFLSGRVGCLLVCLMLGLSKDFGTK